MLKTSALPRSTKPAARVATARFLLQVMASSLLPLLSANAQTPIEDRVVGDLGGAIYYTQSMVRGQSAQQLVLPYAYVDYGRLFARVDTLGLKTVPLGYGYLELTGRVSFEGYKPDSPGLRGINNRSNPLPIGIGTFQETPYGGVFLYAFRDMISGGSLLEATYAAELPLGPVTFYPELGVERRSARYVEHLYGVSATEAAASGLAAYAPGASTSPVLSLTAEVPIRERWALVLQMRRQWLDRAIRDSPLVDTRTQDTAFLAVAYRFK